jgi:hypothetical protein
MKTALAIFCCNRPSHLKDLLKSLYPIRGLDHAAVYFFCDSYRSPEHKNNWFKTKEIINQTILTYGGTSFFSEVNQGLAKSISSGVTKILDTYDAVVVLEDDLILHPEFINFHLRALQEYHQNLDVFQISGFTLKIQPPDENACYFLPSVATWGWSTWRRAWKNFQIDEVRKKIPQFNFRKRMAFDYWGAYSYSQMLESSLAGRNNSWGVLWNWYVYQNKGVVLYPPRSLVYNAGFDGSGIHCGKRSSEHWQLSLEEMQDDCNPSNFLFPSSTSFLSTQLIRQADALIKTRFRDYNDLKNRFKYFYLRLRFRAVRLLMSIFSFKSA